MIPNCCDLELNYGIKINYVKTRLLSIRGIIYSWYLSKGKKKLLCGEYADAKSYFTKAIKMVDSSGSAYFCRGQTWDSLKDYQCAIEDHDVAIAHNPSTAEIYYKRGLANSSLKQKTEAISDYNKAIELKYSDPVVYYLRGLVKKSLQLDEGACQDFRKARELGFEDNGLAFDELCR